MTDPNPNTGKPLDIQDFTNMIGFTNQSAALEFLLTVKNSVRNAAISLTECVTPEVREIVHRQLFQGLDMHEKLSNLMIRKGWLNPHHPLEQLQLDIKSAQMMTNIAMMPLFKDRSKVLETFDTPQ